MKKVLIIYTQAGGGHLSLAQALEQSLKDYEKQSNKVIEKLEIKLVNPFPKIYASGYQRVGTSFQSLYGQNFHRTNTPQAARSIHTLNNLLTGPRLLRIFKEEKPDLVISTVSFATVEVKKALQKLSQKAKVVIFLADPFTPHEVWFTFKEADFYLSPTVEVTEQLLSHKIPPSRIKTVGWLVRKEFGEEHEQKQIRKILGLDPQKFTIFLGGSGQGGGKVYKLAKFIASSQTLLTNSQVITVCGANRQLLNKLAKLNEGFDFFYLLPHVKNMPELLTAADIVVGKAGPNLLFESIFCGRPFLATGCLPGQEDGNLEFIKREDLGWVEENPDKAVKLLEKFEEQRHLIAEKLPNLQRIRKENESASRRIAEVLLKLMR